MAAKGKKHILFRVGDKDFIMPFDPSFKFIGCNILTPLPLVADSVLGLTYYEGRVITILNTAKILNLSIDKNKDKTCLIFDWQDDFYGLVISEAKQIISLHKGPNKYHILTPADIFKKLDIL